MAPIGGWDKNKRRDENERHTELIITTTLITPFGWVTWTHLLSLSRKDRLQMCKAKEMQCETERPMDMLVDKKKKVSMYVHTDTKDREKKFLENTRTISQIGDALLALFL
uniref:F-box associated domain-containing protein n=1 Tax=Ditylenchus dipsaci TaxID=166011 RepID=A0A915EKU6_9BILA